MKKLLVLLLIILSHPIKAFGLIEVDITRGNLNPLPLAVSPLSIDEKSKKSFENLLKKKTLVMKFLQSLKTICEPQDCLIL